MSEYDLKIIEALQRAEQEEADRLSPNPPIEQLPRFIRMLLFDIVHENSSTPERDLKLLSDRWDCKVPPPPPIWRIETWKKLLGSKLFSTLSISASKDLSALQQGMRQGAWICLVRTYEKTLSRYPLATPTRDMESISDLLIDSNHVTNILIRKEREFVSDYMEGLKKGFTRFTSDSGTAIQKNEAQHIYFTLIEYSDHIETLDTVEQIHEFLKRTLKNGFPHQIESFKRRCTDIKLRGVKYREKQTK